MFRTNPDSLARTDLSVTPDIVHGPDRSDLLRPEILGDLFEATAERIPAQTALIFGDRALNYEELGVAADRAASKRAGGDALGGRLRAGAW